MNKLSRTTIIFHWLAAIIVLSLLGLGYYMATYEDYSLYPLHKSLGILALLLILMRVIWRLREGWPIPLDTHKKKEMVAARAVHWALLIAIVGMPVSGVIMGATSGHGVAVFGSELIPRVPDPTNPSAVLAPFPLLDSLSHWVHEWLSYLLVAAVIIHVAGALKHHFLDKDRTLRRMLGQ